MAHALADLAGRFGLELIGDGATRIEGVCTLMPGKPGHLSFLANPKLRSQLGKTQAAAVILRKADAANLGGNGLVAADPYLAYARIAALFDALRIFKPGRDRTAVVSDTAA